MKASNIIFAAAVMVAILPATAFALETPTVEASTTPAVAETAITAVQPADSASATADPAAVVTRIAGHKRMTARATVLTRTAVKKTATSLATARTAAAREIAQIAVQPVVQPVATTSPASDLDTAQALLASLQAQYRYLDGVTVTIDTTPGGYQAVCYYSTGRIVISPTHTATLARILTHEIWHIIDWRDNGTIDWGESVAPDSAADYLK
jgi:hypothetical protein